MMKAQSQLRMLARELTMGAQSHRHTLRMQVWESQSILQGQLLQFIVQVPSGEYNFKVESPSRRWHLAVAV